MNILIQCLLFTHMNGENLHLPVPPVHKELQHKQPHTQKAQLCGGTEGGGARQGEKWHLGEAPGGTAEGAQAQPRRTQDKGEDSS